MKRFKNFEIDDMTWYHILDFRDNHFSKYCKLPKTSEMTKEEILSLFNDMIEFEKNSITDVEIEKIINFRLVPGVADKINDFLLSKHILDWNIVETKDGIEFFEHPACKFKFNESDAISLTYITDELLDFETTIWEENNKNNYINNGKK